MGRPELEGQLYPNGEYTLEAYFDYPGTTAAEWNDVYLGEGAYAGSVNYHKGRNHPNTAYVHVDSTTHRHYSGKLYVIQYHYFYPCNDWWNDHEGDWQRIDVVVSSSDPDDSTIEVLGVEFRFHDAWVTYYKDFPDHPGFTSSFEFNPRKNLKLSQGTHPVVYVGAGSHAAFPVGGTVDMHDVDEGFYDPRSAVGGVGPDKEYMTHTGKVLSTQADESHGDWLESYNLVLLPDPDSDNTNNMGLSDTMSWLGAQIRWGTPSVDGLGIKTSPTHGPYDSYTNSWKNLKFDEVSELGPSGNKDPFHHSDLPYTSYHHWAILGHETWGYRYNPNRDSPGSRSPLPETFRLSRGDTLSLTGDIVIFPNDTLTVVEGSLIEFEPVTDRHQFSVHGADDRRAEIFVYGTLIAEGTFTDSIRFASRDTVFFWDPPAWTGIRVMEGGSVSLSHTRISDTQRPPWPTGLTVQPGNNAATLSWTKSVDPSITHWEYQTKQGLADWGEWLRIDPSDWSTTSYTAENLLRGVTYQFKVQAVNLSGTAASEAVEVTLPAGPPDPPELTVIPGHEMVTLSWTPGSDNGSAIERHELRYSADGGNTWNPDWTAEPPREQIIRNLLNETEYTFQMRAKNAVGYSTVAEVTVTPQHPILGPTALSSAENSEDRLATYRFSAPSDLDLSEVLYGLGLSDIDDSGVFELDNQGGLSFQDAPDFEAPATADRGNLYAVWLRAAPSSEGGGEGVRVEPPPTFLKRVEVTVTNVDEPGRVELSEAEPEVGDRLTAELTDPDKGVEDVDWRWQALPPGTRSTHPPGPGASTASSLLVTSEHIGLTLSAQVTYVDGESEDANDRKSAQSAATAPVVDVPSAPRNLEAAAGNARVDLRWDPPLTDNGSALTGYVVRHSADGGANWMSETLAVTSHTPMGLTNGTEYSFEVRAVNGAGEGASASDTATPERPDTPGRVEWSTNQPRVGQELTPTLIDPDTPALAEARWRWRRQRWPRSDDGDSLSAPAPGSRSGESKLGVIARTRQYRPQVSDLHQWLWVEVTYTDDFGGHRVSATASRAVGPGPPCAPANLKAAPGDGQVTLTWEAGCDNGGTIARYQYRRPEARKWVRVTGDGSARRQQVEGLTNGEAHTFEVRAGNRQEWGPAAEATATPAAAGRTVSFAAAAYQASEGGEAATVTVRLSAPALEALRIPITVNPPSGDFTVAGLTDGGLSFSFGAERQTFTVTATEDDDTVDETVLLGFGDLPEEVSAGTPASATVTLFDDDVGTPVVSLSTASPQVGQRVTATLTDLDGGLEAVAWQWQRRADGSSGWVPIERSARNPDLIADLSRYTPVAADVGKQLRATVSYTDAHGASKSVQSAATDAVTWPPLTVTYGDSTYSASEGGAAATLTVRLSAEAEQLVKIPITRDPASGDYTVTWPGVEDTLSFSGSTTSQSFTVTATEDDDEDDETVLVGFGALPERVEAGTPASATVTLVDDTDHPGTVSLSTASPQVGQRVTATLTDFDGALEAVAWQWQQRADAGSTWETLEQTERNPDLIVDLSRYTPVAADRGKQLRATVGYTDAHGPGKSAQSAATDAVTWPPLTVAYDDSTYSASEGGAAATLTVRLSAEAEQLVKIPITRDPASGDYTVTWPGVEDTLSFSGSTTSQSFTVTATEDDDEDDETVLVGFGALPERVEAGTPASATVTLVDDTDHPGTVRLSTASPEVGQRMTATLTDVDGGLEAVAWQWQRRADAGSAWVPIERSPRYPIVDQSHYTPVAADRGKQLRATVGYTDAHGPNKSAQSAATSSVRPADTPGTVRLSTASPEVGQRVTATLTDVDGGLEAVAWQWQRRADAGSAWVPIERSPRYPIVDLSHYTPVAADRGKQLRATVGYTDAHGPNKSAQSAATSAVRPADTPGTVRLSTASPQVDRELTATLVDEDGYLRDISWRWERRSGPGSAWRDIERPDDRFPHADLSRYTPSSSEAGQQLRATVSYTDGHGPGKSAQSAETDPVQRPDRQGTVRLSTASPQVDRELTATLVDEDGYLRDISWRWERRSGPGSAWRDIERPDDRFPHADLSRYTPSSSEAGQQLRATVSYTDGHGPGKSAQSAETDPVQRPDRQGTVRLSTASPQVGRELTATLVDEDGGLEAVAWQWQRRADASSGWVPIERSARNPIAATSHYTPVTADRGQQLRATVGYTDAHGPDKVAASGETAPVVTVPSVPRDFTAEAGNRQVALSWRAPVSDGGLSLTGYEYRRRAGSGSWSGWTGVGTNTTRTVTGLSNGTRYRFEVRARNAAGAGAAASASATPVQPNRAPYFTSGPTSVSFAENGSGPVGRYTARDPDGDAITWSRTGTEASAFQLEGTGTTRTLTFDTAPDYEAGRSYQVTVEVSDGSLQAERTVRVRVTDEPEPPEPPSGVRVSAPDNMGHERLEVSWTAPDNRGRPALSGNDVHYCKTNEVFFCDSYNIWSSLTVGGSATGTLLTGLSSHTGYTVRVRARNAEGTSGWSARATGRTRSAAAKALAGQLAVTGMKGLAALAAPNPFNPSTTLYFQLTETGEASLVIYSLAGQVVKTLIPNRTLKAGIHQVDWEGRDQQGRPVAAGVYLYRLTAGDKALVRKMTLLR